MFAEIRAVEFIEQFACGKLNAIDEMGKRWKATWKLSVLMQMKGCNERRKKKHPEK